MGFGTIKCFFYIVIMAAIYNKMICILETLYDRRNLIYIHTHIYIYKSHRSKMVVINMKSSKQRSMPVIITMALWQLMHLSTLFMVLHYWCQ